MTPAGVRDGDPEALAGLCARRGAPVLAYCEAVAAPGEATTAAAAAFGRFRAAVVATGDLRSVDPEALLLGATRRAAAQRAPVGGPPLPRRLMRRRAPGTCASVPLLLAARAEDALSPADRGRLDRHLATCPGCAAANRRFVDGERAYRDPPRDAVAAPVATTLIAALTDAAPVRAAGSGAPADRQAEAAVLDAPAGAGTQTPVDAPDTDVAAAGDVPLTASEIDTRDPAQAEAEEIAAEANSEQAKTDEGSADDVPNTPDRMEGESPPRAPVAGAGVAAPSVGATSPTAPDAGWAVPSHSARRVAVSEQTVVRPPPSATPPGEPSADPGQASARRRRVRVPVASPPSRGVTRPARGTLLLLGALAIGALGTTLAVAGTFDDGNDGTRAAATPTRAAPSADAVDAAPATAPTARDRAIAAAERRSALRRTAARRREAERERGANPASDRTSAASGSPSIASAPSSPPAGSSTGGSGSDAAPTVPSAPSGGSSTPASDAPRPDREQATEEKGSTGSEAPPASGQPSDVPDLAPPPQSGQPAGSG